MKDQRRYRFLVQAANTRYDVDITVENEDDEFPFFDLLDSTPCQVSETHIGPTHCQLVVQDRDGIMDGMKFTVKEMDEVSKDIELVKAEGQTCETLLENCVDVVLRIKGELEFIKKPVHSLLLEVEDKGGHTGYMSYIVQVKAENKEIPEVRPDKLTAEINEEYSGVIDFTDTTITVSDRDSVEYGQFYITLEGTGTDEFCYEAFDVIPREGYRATDVKLSVINPERLDYDKGNCNDITLRIKATEINDSTRSGEAEVNIKLKDVNDEAPVFVREIFSFDVDENAEIGTYLGDVNAKDLDAFDSITYSLTSESYLRIDPQNGGVTVNTEFNYERQPQVFVTVKAEDTNAPPHTAYAQITVNIQDLNDERPELYMPSSPTDIDENTPIGEELLVNINARDADGNPELSFGIDWETSRAAKQGVPQEKYVFIECITIDTNEELGNSKSAKAVLRVAKELDWEAFDTLYLTITVEDRNTGKEYQDLRSSSATLTITINDLNDNPPEFSRIDKLSFKENSEEDELVGIIIATDPDGKGNNEVRYYLQDDLYEEEYVTINPTSGELRTGKDKIDFEQIQEISYSVIASDGENSALMHITIEVEDVNDESPKFIGDYSTPIRLKENTDERRGLLFMEASDDDASPKFNTLRFELEELYRGIFEVDLVTGEVFVPQGNKDRLDYEKKNRYEIQITVKDRCDTGNCYGDSLSAMTRITIELEDVNDNAPVIQNGDSQFEALSEDVGQGFPVGYVRAEDADVTDDKKLRYTFIVAEPEEGLELFAIKDDVDTNRGVITVAKDLTDKWGEYRLTVMVRDSGNLYDTSVFTIIVNDINNNQPVFEFPNAATEIRLNIEGNKLGTVLTDVNKRKMVFSATDPKDKGYNGTDGISYAVIGQDVALQYLTMSNDELWLVKEFTEDMERRFELTVEACDGEEVKQCTRIQTHVRLKLTTEYEPTFAQSEWETSFTENVTGLQEKNRIDVEVTDPNNDEDCEEEEECVDDLYFYFIIAGNDDNYFSLESTTGVLSLNKQLDREAVEVYTLTVVVTNFPDGPQGQLQQKSQLKVTVHVTDVIDTQPAFTKPFYAAGINTGDKVNDIVTIFSVTDDDLDDSHTYTIVESTMDVTDSSLDYLKDKTPFSIKGDTLVLNFDVQDSSLKGLFKFNVEVSDKENYKGEASCEIYIISQDNHYVTMRFQNNATYTESVRLKIANIFTDVFKNEANVKKIAPTVDSEGLPISDKTDVTSYFVDEEIQQPINKNEIIRKLTDKQTYIALRDALMDEKLVLESIDDPVTETVANMEGVLQTVLIVVSVVLGSLVVILFAAFFIRTRSLNRRLEALSTTKFGSQDSGLNRIGLAVPNTNQHAVEGSNPVWGNEEATAPDFDVMSQSSGDSDLIGIEENPEFSPYARNGVQNGGFTPEMGSGIQASVNVTVATGFERRASINPLSAGALQDAIAGNTMRKQSVNPMAVTFNGNDSDYENDSRRSSDKSMQYNNNFTFFQRSDSAQATEL
ncbi:hypothetical protein B7P43_G09776 [Cryptotermes secundus]|uniref:Cadherin domain-containing protein n=3 Tax=Cryptotermes secundus TaxID=105785 RepID=A0A2J7Q9Z7_9NEOP|nr:hypothetical protein B7P43_G09776 [Cryptotermes secundus]